MMNRLKLDQQSSEKMDDDFIMDEKEVSTFVKDG
jgi:hypothetical protein